MKIKREGSDESKEAEQTVDFEHALNSRLIPEFQLVVLLMLQSVGREADGGS